MLQAPGRNPELEDGEGKGTINLRIINNNINVVNGKQSDGNNGSIPELPSDPSTCSSSYTGCLYPTISTSYNAKGFCSSFYHSYGKESQCTYENAVPCFWSDEEQNDCIRNCKTFGIACSPLCYDCSRDNEYYVTSTSDAPLESTTDLASITDASTSKQHTTEDWWNQPTEGETTTTNY